MTEKRGDSLRARERRAAVGGGVVALVGAVTALNRDGVGAALITGAVALCAVAVVLLIVHRSAR